MDAKGLESVRFVQIVRILFKFLFLNKSFDIAMLGIITYSTCYTVYIYLVIFLNLNIHVKVSKIFFWEK